MCLLRELCHAELGNAPEIVAASKTLDQWFEKAGYRNRRMYVDSAGPMDTVVNISGNSGASTTRRRTRSVRYSVTSEIFL